MNDDPADDCACLLRRHQLTRELRQDRQSLPHPSIGGSRGYPVWFREAELQRWQNGEEITASRQSIHR